VISRGMSQNADFETQIYLKKTQRCHTKIRSVKVIKPRIVDEWPKILKNSMNSRISVIHTDLEQRQKSRNDDRSTVVTQIVHKIWTTKNPKKRLGLVLQYDFSRNVTKCRFLRPKMSNSPK